MMVAGNDIFRLTLQSASKERIILRISGNSPALDRSRRWVENLKIIKIASANSSGVIWRFCMSLTMPGYCTTRWIS